MSLVKFWDLDSFDLLRAFSMYDRSARYRPLEENSTQEYIYVELPGVKKEDVELNFNGHILEVKAERKEKNYYKKYQNQWEIPQNVDKAKITAKLDNGLLKINLPYLQTENDTKITIT